MALALCRIHSDADAAFARDYLRQASYKALKGELREKKAFADLQNVGQAVTEGPVALSREAFPPRVCRAAAEFTTSMNFDLGVDADHKLWQGIHRMQRTVVVRAQR